MPSYSSASNHNRLLSVSYKCPIFRSSFTSLFTVSLVCTSTTWILFFKRDLALRCFILILVRLPQILNNLDIDSVAKWTTERDNAKQHNNEYKNVFLLVTFKTPRLIYAPLGLVIQNSAYCPHSEFHLCSVRFAEQTEIIFVCNINLLIFTVEAEGLMRDTDWHFQCSSGEG
jgi:hypothetical protein